MKTLVSHFILEVLMISDTNAGYAFPAPDPSIRDYFTRKIFPMDGGNFPMKKDVRPIYDDVIAAYLTFFAELFKVIGAHLKKNINRQLAIEDLANSWREYLDADEDSGISAIHRSIYNQVTMVRDISRGCNAPCHDRDF